MAKITTEAGLLVFRFVQEVNYDRVWADAIRQGAPNTGAGWPIWNVKDQFPKREGTVTKKLLRFVQFGPSFTHQVALDYAKSEGIAHIHPLALFATTEHHNVAADQDRDYLYLNSGLTCSVGGRVHVPDVWCSRDGRRRALVRGVWGEFDERSWFGFRE